MDRVPSTLLEAISSSVSWLKTEPDDEAPLVPDPRVSAMVVSFALEDKNWSVEQRSKSDSLLIIKTSVARVIQSLHRH